MELSNLRPAKGSTHKVKRIGRGQGSGYGGTSTKGHKGAQSRSGYKRKIGFQGGQMPLQRTSPKYGFNNRSRVEYKAINVATLQTLAEKLNVNEISFDTLVEAGLVSKKHLVKVLANGELNKSLKVSAHAFSAKAKEAIEAKGGSIEIIGGAEEKPKNN